MKLSSLIEELCEIQRRLNKEEKDSLTPSSTVSFYTPSSSEPSVYCPFIAPEGGELSVDLEISSLTQTDSVLYVYLGDTALYTLNLLLAPSEIRNVSFRKNILSGGTLSVFATGNVTLGSVSVTVTGVGVRKLYSYNLLQLTGSNDKMRLAAVTDGTLSVYSLPLSKEKTISQNKKALLSYIGENLILARIHENNALMISDTSDYNEFKVADDVVDFTIAQKNNITHIIYLRQGKLYAKNISFATAPVLSSEFAVFGTGLRALIALNAACFGNDCVLVVESSGADEIFELSMTPSSSALSAPVSLGAKNLTSSYYSPSEQLLYFYTLNNDYIFQSKFNPSTKSVSSPVPIRAAQAYARINQNSAFFIDSGLLLSAPHEKPEN